MPEKKFALHWRHTTLIKKCYEKKRNSCNNSNNKGEAMVAMEALGMVMRVTMEVASHQLSKGKMGGVVHELEL